MYCIDFYIFFQGMANYLGNCENKEFMTNVEEINYRLITSYTQWHTFDKCNKEAWCPKYLTINMSNRVFQSPRMNEWFAGDKWCDDESNTNDKIMTAYPKTPNTVTKRPIAGTSTYTANIYKGYHLKTGK